MNNDFEAWKISLMKELNSRPGRWSVNGHDCADLVESVIKTCPVAISLTLAGRIFVSDKAAEEALRATASAGQPLENQLNEPSAGQLCQQAEQTAHEETVARIHDDVPGYERLRQVLESAYNQAARGKGRERHANGLPFDQQPMQTIAQQTGIGFITGQAMKKLGESGGMDQEAAIRELLGAIVYAAGAVIFIEQYEQGRAVRQREQNELYEEMKAALAKRR